ncbi:MAG: DUF2461 domain-containing protein [Flavobacteriales bacterium]|nr:DUF2461 domain-containing protein [Flavobacteriales bacterium]
MAEQQSSVSPSTLSFLRDLAKHNDRDWFQAHKERYQAALANMRGFADALIERMRKHDRISTVDGKDALFRIYSNLRFHPDRPPYKEHFAGGLDRVKPALRGGYYFHIKPGASFIGCGFWNPEKEDLRRIRMDILYDHGTWNKILQGKRLHAHWGDMDTEDQLKTAPKGFPKDHPAIHLLRQTRYTFYHAFADKEVLAADFVDRVDEHFKAIRPWFDHLSEVLTTDENGDPL